MASDFGKLPPSPFTVRDVVDGRILCSFGDKETAVEYLQTMRKLATMGRGGRYYLSDGKGTFFTE